MAIFIELLLIGVGLSMDAFAVSICKGLAMRRVNKKQAFVIGLFFGGFQALMPALGWLLGSQFQSYITAIDHWIAFILLVLIGGKMILDVIKEKGENEEVCPDDSLRINLREIFLLAIATSIDALAIGISFALLGINNYTEILSPILIIGFVSFVMSLIGLYFGIKCGCGCARKLKAELWGGIILVAIGLKILIEHLFLQ